MSIQNLCNVNGYQSEQEFKQNAEWFTMFTHDECVSFQEIVKAELAIPVTNIAERIKQLSNTTTNASDATDASNASNPSTVTNASVEVASVPVKVKQRRAIPKKIRGLTWKEHFGDSMRGACFCCKKTLEALDEWHAGHIVSHANGGKDTVANLRPVCISCNLSMGTENMDDFKARCYSA
jgi:5-methylcytosine-specific restriction endonuclease McrA